MHVARLCRLLLAFVLGIASAASVQAAFNGEVVTGSGSYSTVKPPNVSDVQSTIYKTANVTGKMQTNDWWSSTAWLQYSER